MIPDSELLNKAQRLLDERSARTTGLALRAFEVVRDADIVQVLVAHASDAHMEDYVYILAAVEAELDVEDDVTVLLVPVFDEEAA